MSGETEQNVSGWTTDTLLAHIQHILTERDVRYEQRFRAQETAQRDRDKFLSDLAEERSKQVQVAFQAAEKATAKADVAYEKRFDGQNEFREQLGDQARTFLPRKEYEVQHLALADRVDELVRRIDRTGGRAQGLKDGWGYVVGAVGALAAVIAIVIAIVNH